MGLEIVDQLIKKYRRNGLLVDTNLLLLFIMGIYNHNFIKEHKRTSIFSIEDFKTIFNIIKNFRNLVTTPYILSEVSNLSFQSGALNKVEYFDTFINKVVTFKEIYLEKNNILKLTLLNKVGVSDSVIIEIAQKNNLLVLTDDKELWVEMHKLNIDSINYNHIRSSLLFSSHIL